MSKLRRAAFIRSWREIAGILRVVCVYLKSMLRTRGLRGRGVRTRGWQPIAGMVRAASLCYG